MAQTIVTVVAEVQRASVGLLTDRIKNLNDRQIRIRSLDNRQAFARIQDALPTLHFMSMTVADDPHYAPLFVLEANFDGKPRQFWEDLESAIGPDLRNMLRLCTTPRDCRKALFEKVTADGSEVPLAPLLTKLSVFPSSQHQGNRGLDRRRIIDEGELFAAIQTTLGESAPWERLSGVQIHQRLRWTLLPDFPWLDEPAARRISPRESLTDFQRALVFAGVLLAVFPVTGRLFLLVAGQIFPPVAALWACLDRLPTFWEVPAKLRLSTVLGFVLILVPVAGRLRWLENHDATSAAPDFSQPVDAGLAGSEDHIAQNHMISIVRVKPGVLRKIVARVVHRALDSYLRIRCRSGYLGSMRTIHFAHWAFLDNGALLMFHSNYDGSWESYLDDFIEKAHNGLTLAWSNSAGFPPTRWLYKDGATQGRKFKAWARHSMSESPFWFSAYPKYSVNQIERHARLAAGLRRPVLNEKEARTWTIDL